MPHQTRRILFSLLPIFIVVMVASAHAMPRPDAASADHPTGTSILSSQKNLKSLRALIDSGIVMLEAQEYMPFLRRFITPKDRDELLEKMENGELEDFKEEKVPVLLRVLKQIRNNKPRFSKKGRVATYMLDKDTAPRDRIVFRLEQGVWYLQN